MQIPNALYEPSKQFLRDIEAIGYIIDRYRHEGASSLSVFSDILNDVYENPTVKRLTALHSIIAYAVSKGEYIDLLIFAGLAAETEITRFVKEAEADGKS